MAQLDIEITQGSSFEWLMLINDVNGEPLDMVDYDNVVAGNVRGQIRKKYTDAVATETFHISILNKTGVLAAIAASTVHLTTAEIAALEPDTSGSCYLLCLLSATETAAVAKGTYVYDIEIEDTLQYVFKPFYGTATVSPEATKAA